MMPSFTQPIPSLRSAVPEYDNDTYKTYNISIAE